MFSRRPAFGRKTRIRPDHGAGSTVALRQHIAEVRAEGAPPPSADRLLSGGKALAAQIADTLAAEAGGGHGPSLMAAVGAVAGHACIAALLERARSDGALPEALRLERAGGGHWLGDPIAAALGQGPQALWTTIGTSAMLLGGRTPLPPLAATLARVAATIGTPAFGTPRLATALMPQDAPLDYARRFWPLARRIATRACDGAAEWPVLTALAAVDALDRLDRSLDPGAAAVIALECAAPMASVDPSGLLASIPRAA